MPASLERFYDMTICQTFQNDFDAEKSIVLFLNNAVKCDLTLAQLQVLDRMLMANTAD